MLVLLLSLLGCPSEPPKEPTSDKRAGPSDDRAKPAAPRPAPVVAPLSGLHARGVYASLGDGGALLDGRVDTVWSVAGDALGDRVEVRLEQRVEVDELELVGCPVGVGGVGTWTLVANGAPLRQVVVRPGESLRVPLSAPATLSTFGVVVAPADDARGACLAEIGLGRAGASLALRPPRGVPGHVRPSSVRTPPEAFHPFHLVDGRLELGWSEGRAATGGVGEGIELVLDAPTPLRAIELWNGEQDDPAIRAASPRMTRVAISLDGGPPVLAEVPDQVGPVRIELSPRAPVATVSLVVRAITGDPSRPLSVPEIRLWDAFGPLTVQTPARADRAAVVAGQIGASPLQEWLDERLVPVCGGPGELRLRANLDLHLVAPGADLGRPEPGLLAWDGMWAPRVGEKGWTALRFAGRVVPRDLPLAPAPGDGWVDGAPFAKDVSLARVGDLGAEKLAALLEEAGRALPAAWACLAPRAKDAPDLATLTARGAWIVRGDGVTGLYWRPEGR